MSEVEVGVLKVETGRLDFEGCGASWREGEGGKTHTCLYVCTYQLTCLATEDGVPDPLGEVGGCIYGALREEQWWTCSWGAACSGAVPTRALIDLG